MSDGNFLPCSEASFWKQEPLSTNLLLQARVNVLQTDAHTTDNFYPPKTACVHYVASYFSKRSEKTSSVDTVIIGQYQVN